METMKKPLIALCSVLLLLSAVACSGDGTASIDQPVLSAGQKGDTAATGQSTSPPAKEGTAALAQKTDAAKGAASLAEQVLLDKKDVLITATGMVEDSWMGPGLKIRIENNSKKDLTVQTRSTSVNGYMVDGLLSADVAAGKKSNDELTFSSDELEAAGIADLADIELNFHIFTQDDWETYLDSDPITIKTSLADTYEYRFDDTGKLLYEKNGIRILAKGISDSDSLFGPGLILFIENLSKKSITVQSRDVSVNGYMIDASLSSEVSPGKRALDALTFFQSDLEKNDIEKFTDVELAFHIFETDDYDTLDDTKKYVLTFQ